jgi:uncharacterized protein (TIGR02996 family)
MRDPVHDGLWRTVLANPGDDAPKLALLDWLEENRPGSCMYVGLKWCIENRTWPQETWRLYKKDPFPPRGRSVYDLLTLGGGLGSGMCQKLIMATATRSHHRGWGLVLVRKAFNKIPTGGQIRSARPFNCIVAYTPQRLIWRVGDLILNP